MQNGGGEGGGKRKKEKQHWSNQGQKLEHHLDLPAKSLLLSI